MVDEWAITSMLFANIVLTCTIEVLIPCNAWAIDTVDSLIASVSSLRKTLSFLASSIKRESRCAADNLRSMCFLLLSMSFGTADDFAEQGIDIWLFGSSSVEFNESNKVSTK